MKSFNSPSTLVKDGQSAHVLWARWEKTEDGLTVKVFSHSLSNESSAKEA